MVVVKWSECSRSTPTIRVQIHLKSTVLFCTLFEKNQNEQKDVCDDPFLKIGIFPWWLPISTECRIQLLSWAFYSKSTVPKSSYLLQ